MDCLLTHLLTDGLLHGQGIITQTLQQTSCGGLHSNNNTRQDSHDALQDKTGLYAVVPRVALACKPKWLIPLHPLQPCSLSDAQNTPRLGVPGKLCRGCP